MRPAVRGVLFDLDDTLFDHTHATFGALRELQAMAPVLAGWPVEELRRAHSEALEEMHREVLAGRLTIPEARETRFRRLLLAAQGRAGADDDLGNLPRELASAYRQAYERAWQAVPGAVAVLARLKEAGVRIAVVTNNIRSEQVLKMARCGLDSFVDVLITSEDEGVAKPAPAIFAAALRAVELDAASAVMVGDAWDTDITGARAAGVLPVWFNRKGVAAPEPGVHELRSYDPADEVVSALRGTGLFSTDSARSGTSLDRNATEACPRTG